MPNTKSAKKRLRQNVGRRARNRTRKSMVKTQLKKVLAAIGTDNDQAQREFQLLQKKLDRAAARGAVHPNAAARLKSRINARLKAAKTAATV